MTSPAEHLERHRAAGRRVDVDGTATFVREEGGAGAPAVLCLHGVPASSYLYRKVLPELAARDVRGVAFDLPGLGFADRPQDFDYSWTGLARWAVDLPDALGPDDVHLVVHDIGGPVGLLMAEHLGDRVRSITVLNTIVDPPSFTPPPVMRPFTVRGLGEVWLRGTFDAVFMGLMRWQGVHDRDVPDDELVAYRHQLLREDGGAAFLRMMRSYEYTEAVASRMRTGLQQVEHRQVVWGEHDPALPIDEYGETARAVAGVDTIHRLPGRHFLQEDCAPALAALVAELVHTAAT
jgi:pimeloyl-ACP methyl ester carboxylesterase